MLNTVLVRCPTRHDHQSDVCRMQLKSTWYILAEVFFLSHLIFFGLQSFFLTDRLRKKKFFGLCCIHVYIGVYTYISIYVCIEICIYRYTGRDMVI